MCVEIEKINFNTICFNDDLLDAIIKGTKTVTRRVIKTSSELNKSKYNVGDLVPVGEPYILYTSNIDNITRILYKRDIKREEFEKDTVMWENAKTLPLMYIRYWIKITDVRQEHVQDISLQDIIDEGIFYQEHIPESVMKQEYETLWNILYKKQGNRFEDNPLVWVYKFKLVNL